MTNKYYNRQILIVSIIVAFGFTGVALPYPVITPYIFTKFGDLQGTNEHIAFFNKSVLLGILLACYPLGQFIGSPLVGMLSDLLGRKKVLVWSLLGTSVGYGLSGYGISNDYLGLLLMSRLWTGFCEGNIAVAQAAVSDMGHDKSKSYGRINSAVAIGYIIGPLLGGLFSYSLGSSNINYSLPFFIGMTLCFISILLVVIFFKETLSLASDTHKNLSHKTLIAELAKIFKNTRKALSKRNLKELLIFYLITYIGVDLFYEFYPLFFSEKWEFSVIDIAIYSAVYTLPYALSQEFLVPKLNKHFQPIVVLKKIIPICAFVLIVLIIPKSHYSLLVSLPILGVTTAFFSTNIAILISDATQADEQGVVFGTFQSLRVLNNSLIAMMGGYLALVMNGFPILVGGLAIAVGFLYLSRLNLTFDK